MKKILFVCTGNTCRSPMAAAIFKSFGIKAKVDSAGLFADGSDYSEKAVTALQEIGIDISGGVSRLFRYEDLSADYIFCMSESHKQMLLTIGADGDKIIVLDVCDPYGMDIEAYRACRDEIRDKLSAFDIKIRPFQEDDAAAVAEIEKICFSTPWSEQALLDSHRGNTAFFVAYNPISIIGYAGVQTAADESYVTNIAVLPAYRGLGVGEKLTESLLKFSRDKNMAFLSLEVRESNLPAIALYEKLGFKTAGFRKNFYDSPKENAIIMTKVNEYENSCD